MKKLILASLLMSASVMVMAKLPAPSDEAKAKAAEAAAKTAWTGKVDAYLLCKSQDKVSAAYRKTHKDAKPAAADLPACADPGPFSYTPPEAKPLEASGAHSPAGTATSPPSTKAPAATLPAAPAKKS
jgi:hypothetical protein